MSDRPEFKSIRARITLREHEGEIVASVSDGEGEITIHRESDEGETAPPTGGESE